jgi:hypothetical protein
MYRREISFRTPKLSMLDPRSKTYNFCWSRLFYCNCEMSCSTFLSLTWSINLWTYQGTITDWKRCNKSLAYEENVLSVVDYHLELVGRGYRSLIYRWIWSNTCTMFPQEINSKRLLVYPPTYISKPNHSY